MPQSHQELFGYYMNQVLERDDDNDEVFVASDNNSKRDQNSPQSNNFLNKVASVGELHNKERNSDKPPSRRYNSKTALLLLF